MSNESIMTFKAVFENSPVGLVLVNSDTTLRRVNNYMFRTFKLEPIDILGQRFGNIFSCAAVSGKQDKCGESEECSQCGLRAGVVEVLNSGMTIPDTVMDHRFVIDGAIQKKWFTISASRIVTEKDAFAVVSFADITTQKNYEELLHNQLTLDMATGATNKFALLNTLKSLFAGKEDITVAMIDFDDFKSVNDLHGHVAGDKVLNIFCSCALANTRKQDILGRFGGEEFMLVFPGMSAGLLIRALQRIAVTFREKCTAELGISSTFSAGISEFSAAKMVSMDVDKMIAEADSNLYISKARGKNRVTVDGLSISL